MGAHSNSSSTLPTFRIAMVPYPCSSDHGAATRSTIAYADSAYSSPRVATATLIGIEIVRKFADQTGGDDPKDQEMIKRGIEDRDNGC